MSLLFFFFNSLTLSDQRCERKLMWRRSLTIRKWLLSKHKAICLLYYCCYNRVYIIIIIIKKEKGVDSLRGLQAHKPFVLSSMLHYGLEHGWYCHFKETGWLLNTIFTNVHLRLNCLALTIVAAVKHFWINYNNNIDDHSTIIYYQSKSITVFFFLLFQKSLAWAGARSLNQPASEVRRRQNQNKFQPPRITQH